MNTEHPKPNHFHEFLLSCFTGFAIVAIIVYIIALIGNRFNV